MVQPGPARIAHLSAGRLEGSVRAPSSKSLSNRLLVIASLSAGTSLLTDVLDSDDTAAMRAALLGLGVAITERRDGLVVVGTPSHLGQSRAILHARLSGTTLRYLAGVALLAKSPVTLDGDEPLRRRPIDALLDAIAALGAGVDPPRGPVPVEISSTGFAGGAVTIDASASSQFATALLLPAPLARDGLRLRVVGGDLAYVRLTVSVMTRWGAAVVEEEPGVFVVAPRSPYQARDEAVPYDASAAAHLFALGLATGGSVRVENAVGLEQPDARIVEVMGAMGAQVRRETGAVTVSAGGRLVGIDVDLGSMPDQVPTVAVLGALAEGTTRVSNVAIARGHETDRLHAVATELGRLGASVEERADGLEIRGGSPLRAATVQTYDDHRIAMAFAALARAVPGIAISEPGCVSKTYPGFWDDARRLGMAVEEGDDAGP